VIVVHPILEDKQSVLMSSLRRQSEGTCPYLIQTLGKGNSVRSFGRVKASVLGFLLVSMCSVSISAEPISTDSPWQSYLSFFAEELEARHIDLFHSISPEEFHLEIERLKELENALTPSEQRVALMRLARRIGDGHTAIPLWSDAIRRYPFEVSLIDQSVIVTGTTESHSELLGAELVRVNQVPVSVIKSKLEQIVPFVENAHSLRVRTGLYFLVEDLLSGIGVTASGAPVKLVFRQDRAEVSIETSSIDQVAFETTITHRIVARNPKAYFLRNANGTDTLWFGDRDDGKTIYIQFDRYPSAEQMQDFSSSLLSHIREHGSNSVIIDLRKNFGGDFFTGLLLASYLNLADTIDWEDGTYVLIGNRTFSAAMSNAAQFRQILNAKLVGAPTGARPCGYQDMGQFELPNSGMIVTHSKRRFCFIDTAADSILPDQLIEPKLEDYLDSTDRALDWVIQDIAQRR